MTKEGYAKLTLILFIIAAALALSAALIEYSVEGDINIALIAAGLFILAFGLGARKSIGR